MEGEKQQRKLQQQQRWLGEDTYEKRAAQFDTLDIHDTKVHSLVELNDGTLLSCFAENDDCIEAWSYSPSEDCFQHLWKFGQAHHSTPPTSLIDLGDNLIASCTRHLSVWDLRQKHQPLYSIYIGSHLLIEKTIRLKRHSDALKEGKTLLLTGASNSLILWDIDKNKRAPGEQDSKQGCIEPSERKEFVSMITVPSLSGISCLWEMSDGHVLVGTWNNMVALVDIVNGVNLLVCDGHTNRVNDIVEHQPGLTFASASSDKTIKVWDIKSGLCVMTLQGHTKAVKKLLKPNDEYGYNALLSGSHDKTIKRWDTGSGVCVWSIDFSAGIDTFIELREEGTLIVGLNNNSLESFRLKPRSVADRFDHSIFLTSLVHYKRALVLLSAGVIASVLKKQKSRSLTINRQLSKLQKVLPDELIGMIKRELSKIPK